MSTHIQALPPGPSHCSTCCYLVEVFTWKHHILTFTSIFPNSKGLTAKLYRTSCAGGKRLMSGGSTAALWLTWGIINQAFTLTLAFQDDSLCFPLIPVLLAEALIVCNSITVLFCLLLVCGESLDSWNASHYSCPYSSKQSNYLLSFPLIAAEVYL